MKPLCALVFSLLGLGSGLSTASVAPAHAAVLGGTFTNSVVTFTYPSTWSPLTAATVKSIAAPFATLQSGMSLAGAGGVRENRAKIGGAIVVMFKLVFSPSFQRQVKNRVSVFNKNVIAGIEKAPRSRVVGRSHARLSGQPALTLDMVVSGHKPTYQKYYVAVAGDKKSAYLALAVISPPRSWTRYSAAVAGIIASAHFNSMAARGLEFHTADV